MLEYMSSWETVPRTSLCTYIRAAESAVFLLPRPSKSLHKPPVENFAHFLRIRVNKTLLKRDVQKHVAIPREVYERAAVS